MYDLHKIYRVPTLDLCFCFTDVLLSAIGALIWTIAIITWLSIYVQNRAAWGELGDYISFTIPMGSP